MHPIRQQRLILVLLVVVMSSIAIGLLVYALRDNINLFYPPSEFSAGDVPHNVRLRGGGCVKPGSVVHNDKTLAVAFTLVDSVGSFRVKYRGVLPDLFAQGQAAVVTGLWKDDNIFYADQVLAKHDENYMPPEVADAMKKGKGHQATCKSANYDS